MSTTLIIIYCNKDKPFTAGVEVDTGRMYNRCAPIVAYMRTWSSSRIRKYCKSRGWGTVTIRMRERI